MEHRILDLEYQMHKVLARNALHVMEIAQLKSALSRHTYNVAYYLVFLVLFDLLAIIAFVGYLVL